MNFLDERLPDRFWRKVTPEPNSGCWLWTAGIDSYGYGQLRDINGRIVLAHRFAFSLLIRLCDPDLELDHLCRERSCCNPDHLEEVTHAENMRRGVGNGFRERTHCGNGHEYTLGNTAIAVRDGYRYRACRACRRESANNCRVRRRNPTP